jgi:alpha-L-rhamnosidase
MVGLRALYMALNQCGLEEYAYRIITAKGRPSYGEWLDGGATTLWEKWNDRESKNHHMYSDFMSWLMKTPGGINHAEGGEGFTRVKIAPRFLSALDWCRVSQHTVRGQISLGWTRSGDVISLTFTVPEGMTAEFDGREYAAGEYHFEFNA